MTVNLSPYIKNLTCICKPEKAHLVILATLGNIVAQWLLLFLGYQALGYINYPREREIAKFQLEKEAKKEKRELN